MHKYIKKNWISTLTLIITIIGVYFAFRVYIESKPIIKIETQLHPLEISRFPSIRDEKERYEAFLEKFNLPRDENYISEFLFIFSQYLKHNIILNLVNSDDEALASISDQNLHYLKEKYQKLDRQFYKSVYFVDVVLPYTLRVFNNGGSKTTLIYKKITVKGFGVDVEKIFEDKDLNIEVDAGTNKSFDHTYSNDSFLGVYMTYVITPVFYTVMDDLFGIDGEKDEKMLGGINDLMKNHVLSETVKNKNDDLHVTIVFQDQHGLEWTISSILSNEEIFKSIQGIDDKLGKEKNLKSVEKNQLGSDSNYLYIRVAPISRQ